MKKQKEFKLIPKFVNEDDEREFWAKHDSTDYINWSQAVVNPEFPNLKPSTKIITIRVPEWLLNSLKTLANRKDVPYQSLLKILLAEKVEEKMSEMPLLRDKRNK
ncbi:hypothetical protein A3F34_00070 [Candidatus Roizmanbacteria bacterium RIFCSPHIGHO2_12_FULL_44_10]|uniref:Antitoxin n=1 Tax=Candidatus Roizmanbacteria bacterium RIFCSPHIGHO2_12_FULL_44_10 TaxID=1802054 RepID=A0A1F7I508_9BACT|nr:MAG: hypothetical protein A3F34_00070 [Candidatus Roizmanbacteria bacterium RIFCSPHIGHO2_12_FULL_44_10]